MGALHLERAAALDLLHGLDDAFSQRSWQPGIEEHPADPARRHLNRIDGTLWLRGLEHDPILHLRLESEALDEGQPIHVIGRQPVHLT
ncbi:hypothetical protein D3C80_2011980 [compost metagenome]